MSKKYRVGIDLGGTNIKAGVVDENNCIVATAKRKTKAERPWQQIADDIIETAKEALTAANVDISDCKSVGIGTPGTVNAQTGVIVFAANFYNFENIPMGKYVEKGIGMPVSISNDANCAALGEYVAGAAKNAESTVLITLGTGVGGGVVFDGKVFEGGGPGGAELGHTTLIAGGEACTCGRKGCFEAYASATALVREAKKAAIANPNSLLMKLCEGNVENMNGVFPFTAARQNDEVALAVVNQYIEWLGEGIVNMINTFRPKIVLISGGICGEGEYLTDPLNEYAAKYSFAGSRVEIPPIIAASLGNDAGIIGAASL